MLDQIKRQLSHDHARLAELLTRATALETVDVAAYGEFRAGLLRHIAMEEKVLFVALRARPDRSVDPLLAQLHADHAALASLLVPPPTHALIATIEGVLDEHNPLEEDPGGLYDLCDQLAAPEVEALLVKMAAIPAVRVSQHLDEPRIHAHIERMLIARSVVQRS